MKDILNYLDIIILAVLVLFLLFKLRSLLGKKVGYQKLKTTKLPEITGISGGKTDGDNSSSSLPQQVNNYPEGSLAYKIKELENKEPSFKQDKFLESAKKAFNLIIESIAKNDLSTVSAFLDENVYSAFKNAIDNRVAFNKKQYVNIKSFLITDIIDVSINGNISTITVKFVTEQQKDEYDSSQDLSELTKRPVKMFTDIWFFSKEINDGKSIWKLVKTR